jgi:hypothetical protein
MRRDLEGRTARQLVVAGAPVAGEDEGGVGRGRGSRGCNGGGRNDGCGEARLHVADDRDELSALSAETVKR